MSVEIGSHLKTFPGKGKGYGQNGDPTAQPAPHARTRNRDKKHGFAQPAIPLVSPPMVDVPGLDPQDQLSHRLKGGKNVEAHPYAAWPRTASTGSPGGPVPHALGYGREAKAAK
jgi:hypothetical protein